MMTQLCILFCDDAIAWIDEPDLENVAAYTWATVEKGRTRYAYTEIGGRRMYLHRFVTAAASGQIVDHRNCDGLDCTRTNLRSGTNQQNLANRRPIRNGSSRFKGVSRSGSRWQAQIQFNGRNRHLGRFHTEEEAARAYDAAAKDLHGEWAWLNFRNEQHSSGANYSLNRYIM